MSRSRQTLWLVPLSLTTLLSTLSCEDDRGSGARGSGREIPLVFTTNHPLQYCTARIAGEFATVECIVPPGIDPLHWRPDRDAIARLQTADLIVRNGASAEPWVFSSSLPASRLLNTTRPFSDRFVERQNAVTHSHGGGETHTHAATVPHTWTDPRLLKQQVTTVLSALIAMLPDREPELRDRARALSADLDALDAQIARLPEPSADLVLLSADEIYGYLAQRTGWTIVDLALDPAMRPEQLVKTDLKTALGSRSAGLLLWPYTPNESLRQHLEQTYGIRSVVFTPAGALPTGSPPSGGPDYLELMRENVTLLAQALAGD